MDAGRGILHQSTLSNDRWHVQTFTCQKQKDVKIFFFKETVRNIDTLG